MADKKYGTYKEVAPLLRKALKSKLGKDNGPDDPKDFGDLSKLAGFEEGKISAFFKYAKKNPDQEVSAPFIVAMEKVLDRGIKEWPFSQVCEEPRKNIANAGARVLELFDRLDIDAQILGGHLGSASSTDANWLKAILAQMDDPVKSLHKFPAALLGLVYLLTGCDKTWLHDGVGDMGNPCWPPMTPAQRQRQMPLNLPYAPVMPAMPPAEPVRPLPPTEPLPELEAVLSGVIGEGAEAHRTVTVGAWLFIAPGVAGTEPMIPDYVLMERVEFLGGIRDFRRRIRELMAQEGARFAPLQTVARRPRFTSDGKSRGSVDVTEYLFTAPQAMFLVSQINTLPAREATHEMIRVWDLARRRLLPGQQATVSRSIDERIVTLLERQQRQTDERMEAFEKTMRAVVADLADRIAQWPAPASPVAPQSPASPVAPQSPAGPVVSQPAINLHLDNDKRPARNQDIWMKARPFVERVKVAKVAKGMSYETLCEQSGCTRASFFSLARRAALDGECHTHLTKAWAMAATLNVPLPWLARGEGPDPFAPLT